MHTRHVRTACLTIASMMLLLASSTPGSASASPSAPRASDIRELSVNARGIGVAVGNSSETTLSRDGSVAVYQPPWGGPELLAAHTDRSSLPMVVTATSDGLSGGRGAVSWSVTDDGSQVFFLEDDAGILAHNGHTSRSLVFVKDLTTGRLSTIRTPVVNYPSELGGTQRLKAVGPVRVSGDGQRVGVILQGTRSVGSYVYDVPSSRWINICPTVTNCLFKALSPDGRYAIIDDIAEQARIVDVNTGESRLAPDSPPPGPPSTPFSCLFTGDSHDAICTVQGGVPFGPSYISPQFDVATLDVVRHVAFTSYGGVRAVDAHGDRWTIQVSRDGKPPGLHTPSDGWVLQADTGAKYRLNLAPDSPGTGSGWHQGNGRSTGFGISNDGHTVLFTSTSTDLDPADRTAAWSVFAATVR